MRSAVRTRGFTLVEVLVALTLIGLVAGIGAGALHLAVTTRTTVDARSAALQELRAAGTLLRARLEQARPAPWRWRADGANHALAGSGEALHFAAPLPERWADGRLYLFSVEPEDARGQTRLMLSYRALPERASEPVPPEPLASFVLLDDIAGVSWSYLGWSGTGHELRWHHGWEQARLPRLIRLEIEPADPRLEAWPAWIVAPAFGGRSASDLRIVPRGADDDND